MSGGSAIRGSRVGAGPMGEAERGEAAPREYVAYVCATPPGGRPAGAAAAAIRGPGAGRGSCVLLQACSGQWGGAGRVRAPPLGLRAQVRGRARACSSMETPLNTAEPCDYVHLLGLSGRRFIA